MARPVFIIDGSRTPFLKARSGPGPFTPVDLAEVSLSLQSLGAAPTNIQPFRPEGCTDPLLVTDADRA